MSIRLGSAYAEFSADIRPLRLGVEEARALLRGLRTDMDAISQNRVTPSVAPAATASRTAGGSPAQNAANETRAVGQAADRTASSMSRLQRAIFESNFAWADDANKIKLARAEQERFTKAQAEYFDFLRRQAAPSKRIDESNDRQKRERERQEELRLEAEFRARLDALRTRDKVKSLRERQREVDPGSREFYKIQLEINAAERQFQREKQRTTNELERMGRVLLRTKLAGKEYGEQIRILRQELAQLAPNTLEAARVTAQLARAQALYDRANPATTLRSIGQGIIGTAGGIGLERALREGANGIRNMVVGSVQLNQRLETTTTVFRAITGNATLADQAVQQILKHGNEARIFDRQKLLEGAQAILPYTKNTEDLIEKLKVIETLAAINPNEGIAGAAFSLREALSGDFRSLQERFNLPRSLLRDLVGEAKTPEAAFLAVIEVLNRLGITYDLVTSQQTTLLGRIGELRNVGQDILRSFGTGLFNSLNSAFGDLLATIAQNRTAILSFAQGLGEGVADGFGLLVGLVSNLASAWNALGPVGQKVVLTLGAVALAIKPLMIGIGALTASFGPLAAAFTFVQGYGLAAGLTVASRAIVGMISPVGLLVTAIGAVAIAYAASSAAQEQYIKKQQEAAEITKQGVSVVQDANAALERLRSQNAGNSILDAVIERRKAEIEELRAAKDEAIRELEELRANARAGAHLSNEALSETVVGGAAEAKAAEATRRLQEASAALSSTLEANTEFLVLNGRQVTTLAGQFLQAEANGAQFARQLERATGIDAADKLKIVQAVISATGSELISTSDKARILQSAFRDLYQRVASGEVEFGPEVIAQLGAIGAAIGQLKAQTPIVITVEMRMQQAQSLTSLFGSITQQLDGFQSQMRDLTSGHEQAQAGFARQIEKANQNAGAQAAKAARDFGQQQAKAARDFGQQQARAERDYLQQQARANRDFRRAEQQAAEEHSRKISDIQEELGRDLIEIERDTRKRLQDLQEDYDVGRVRDEEDFARKRRRLLAEGKVAEAQRLAEDFAIDQRRKAEDLSRNRSDAADSGDTSASDKRADAERSLQEERDNYTRQRQERLESFRLQQADAAAAYAQQKADAAAAFAQQQADARAAFAQQQNDAKAAAGQQIAQLREQAAEEQEQYNKKYAALQKDYDAYVQQVVEDVKKAGDDQRKIAELVRAGLTEEEAKIIVGLENAQALLTAKLGQLGRDLTKGGRLAGISWLLAFARGLTESLRGNANEIDDALIPVKDRFVPRSPIRRGPLAGHERGGYKAGVMYIDAFAQGLRESLPKIDQSLRTMQGKIAQDMRIDPVQGGRLINITVPQQSQADLVRDLISKISVQVSAQSGNVYLDGTQVGMVMAPVIERNLTNEGRTRTTLAAGAPTRTQSTFRQLDG